MRTIFGAAALALALASIGCIEKDTTHTIYLSPDGSAVWTAMEQDVRSSEGTSQAGRDEEAGYLAAALTGTHDVALALGALEPSRLQTRVLRRERPFAALTDAHFPDIAVLGVRVLGELGLPGDVYVTKEGDVSTLHLHLDFRAAADSEARDTAVVELIEPLSAYRIVLTDGHFVAAEGFTLDSAGRTAIPIAQCEEIPETVIDLSLSWRR